MTVELFEKIIILVCGPAVLDSIKDQVSSRRVGYYKSNITGAYSAGKAVDLLLTWATTREGYEYWHHIRHTILSDKEPWQLLEEFAGNKREHPFNKVIGGI